MTDLARVKVETIGGGQMTDLAKVNIRVYRMQTDRMTDLLRVKV